MVDCSGRSSTRRIGIKASYTAWSHDHAIKWALMPQCCSALPPRYQLGVNGERTPVHRFGGGGSGFGVGGSRGLVIHCIMKGISCNGMFPMLMKTN
jgi:hypothetical protein